MPDHLTACYLGAARAGWRRRRYKRDWSEAAWDLWLKYGINRGTTAAEKKEHSERRIYTLWVAKPTKLTPRECEFLISLARQVNPTFRSRAKSTL